jgi:hypothetical protein
MRAVSTRAAARCGVAAVALLAASLAAEAAVYTVTNTADSGLGSLRQAISDANATPEADHIHFAIPGTGIKTIAVSSQLPLIISSLTIDGYTQTGAAPNTINTFDGGLNTALMIELAGSGGFYGLAIDRANGVVLTVQGLNMHGFLGCLAGAPSAGSSQLRSFGNLLCSDIAGSAGAIGPRTDYGIVTFRTPSFIGGDLPAQRNLISGCANAGLVIDGDAQLRGNLVGTDISGTQALPGGGNDTAAGLRITNANAQIAVGGNTATARNVISGNRSFAIAIIKQGGAANYSNLTIHGNFIGTDWRGLSSVPNGFATPNLASFGGGIQVGSSGVGVSDPTPVTIGGFGAGEGNLIAFNHGSGIVSFGNAVGDAFDSQGNAIRDNTFGGATNVDLGEFGRTPNDSGDGDAGVNEQQNYPEILSVTENGNQATVTYWVDTATSNASYPLRVDFYVGINEGSGAWIAQDLYPASAAQQTRSFVFNMGNGVRGFPLTATASSAGHTSELAPVFDRLFRDGFE